MRVKLTIESGEVLRVPFSYNQLIQGWIYNLISDESYRRFLHEVGYRHEKRSFKLFTFSRLEGEVAIDSVKKEFCFRGPVYVYVCSPVDMLMEDIVNTAISRDDLYIGRNKVVVTAAEVRPAPDILNEERGTYRIKTLSPVVAYSTFEHPGKSKTHFYSPLEPEFSGLLRENLVKKSRVLAGANLGEGRVLEGEFSIRPLYSPVHRGETAVLYKGFYIKGHMGQFEVKASPEWLRVAWETGLGSKNSQGFGMIDVIGKTVKDANR